MVTINSVNLKANLCIYNIFNWKYTGAVKCDGMLREFLKSKAYQYKLVLFFFVWFLGMSTIVGYSMPNPFYTYKEFYFKQFNLA